MAWKEIVEWNYRDGGGAVYREYTPGADEVNKHKTLIFERHLKPGEKYPPDPAPVVKPAEPKPRSTDPNELAKMGDLNSTECRILQSAIQEWASDQQGKGR